MQQNSDLGDAPQQLQVIKRTLIAERRRRKVEAATELKSGLPQPLKSVYVAELGSEKGANSWPIAEHGFAPHKGAF